ncbi:hypothetical protein GcM1_01990 [Golovinomyces cichoracearum]|uniref:Secreted protein n=1 Tax=Golovinomyces cichoracearum TaxID=62708 RepID=A0A420IIL3_9PEZI|nr:hypothetical protein GcM1_01990 [Golovinomyces cichoracearum]
MSLPSLRFLELSLWAIFLALQELLLGEVVLSRLNVNEWPEIKPGYEGSIVSGQIKIKAFLHKRHDYTRFVSLKLSMCRDT